MLRPHLRAKLRYPSTKAAVATQAPTKDITRSLQYLARHIRNSNPPMISSNYKNIQIKTYPDCLLVMMQLTPTRISSMLDMEWKTWWMSSWLKSWRSNENPNVRFPSRTSPADKKKSIKKRARHTQPVTDNLVAVNWICWCGHYVQSWTEQEEKGSTRLDSRRRTKQPLKKERQKKQLPLFLSSFFLAQGVPPYPPRVVRQKLNPDSRSFWFNQRRFYLGGKNANFCFESKISLHQTTPLWLEGRQKEWKN